MTKHSSDVGKPTVRINSVDSPESPTPSSSHGNVFTSFIKKVPYSQLSPALKRRAGPSKSVPADSAATTDQNKRSAVSQILHSVPDAVKKKFSRGGPSPDLQSSSSWGSADTLEYEDSTQRRGNFKNVLEQINSADTPLLRNTRSEPIEASQITMVTPSIHDPDNLTVESDDENVDPDGLFATFFSQLNSVVDVDREIIKVKSEIEVTQRNNTELTKKYLEVSKTVSDSQIPDLATREQYNQKNLKSQKHVRELQNKLKKLEERKKKIREQDLMSNGYVTVELQEGGAHGAHVTGHVTGHVSGGEVAEGKRTPDHKKPGVIQRTYEKAVAKRRKTRPQDGNWGSDGAIDQSSGVIELAEAIGESISSSSREAHLPETHDTSNPAVEFSSVISDEEEGNTNNEEFENISDRVDSASNVSENANLAEIARLREDFTELLREVKELRESYKEGIRQVNANLIKQHDYFVEAIEQSDLRMRQIDDRVDDKLDKFHYSSDERIKEIEERLDDYKYKMTRFEELQEQRRMENPLTGNDIASRGRDVMSSVISLGLATVSLLLFVFTTAVDFLKVFSENNLLSTGLSLGLFAAIIFTYHYFDADRTS